MNESEESNVTPRSRNIGTKLIAVSSILIDLGKCSLANPFRAKVWLQFSVIHNIAKIINDT